MENTISLRTGAFAAITVLSAALGVLVGTFTANIFGGIARVPYTSYSTGPNPPIVSSQVPQQEAKVMEVVSKVQPAVVSILISKQMPMGSTGQIPLLERFFGSQSPAPQDLSQLTPNPVQIGGGSGFFISPDGLIATNGHVVSDDSAVYTVVTEDGKEYSSKVIARDPSLDVAYLKVDGHGFPYLTFGQSGDLKLGQTVLAIGNALDQFRNTVTMGIVSGLNRRIVAGGDTSSANEIIEDAIQTDAAINPGNSGGPLVDLGGNVVGINTAISLEGQLISFALPSDLIKTGAQQVIKTGKVTRPFLGVRYQMLDAELATAKKIPTDHGALLIKGTTDNGKAVLPGSPAEKSGLQEGDVIVQLDGVPVEDGNSLGSLLLKHSPGDTITLQVWRNGHTLQIKADLGTYGQ